MRFLFRLDDLFHRLHMVPGGYLVPTSWLCWWRQRIEEREEAR